MTHGDSDTDSIATILAVDVEHEDPAEQDEVRSVGGVEDVASEAEEEVTFQLPGVATRRAGFVSLEAVVMEEEFDERACVMKSVPRFLRGPYRIVALEEIESADDTRRELGWKLFLLLPRLLLHRSPRGGTIPRSKLLKRFDLQPGRVDFLLEASRVCCDEAAVARRRRGRRAENDMASRISRAEALVHMGELLSARQALEGSALAPGSVATLNALWDPLKPSGAARSMPRLAEVLQSMRTVGPCPDSPRDSGLHPSWQADCTSETEGGVRGIVSGDIVRRLVARTMSQQLMDRVQCSDCPVPVRNVNQEWV